MAAYLKRGLSVFVWILDALGISEMNEMLKERRWHIRLETDFDVLLTADAVRSKVRGVNIDKNGLGVVSHEPMFVGEKVFIRIPVSGVMGFAEVRHCSALRSAEYRVGLRFCERLVADNRTRHDQCLTYSSAGAWDEPAD